MLEKVAILHVEVVLIARFFSYCHVVSMQTYIYERKEKKRKEKKGDQVSWSTRGLTWQRPSQKNEQNTTCHGAIGPRGS
jgi:hypothetical protein